MAGGNLLFRSKGWSAVVGCGLLLLFVWSGGKAAEVFLGITKTEGEKIPLGVIRFEVAAPLSDEGRLAREILETDLRRSQIFRVLELPHLKYQGSQGKAGTDWLKKIQPLGTEGFVRVRLTEREEDIVLEGHVYDSRNGLSVFSKRFSSRKSHLRAVVHRFSDEIVYLYTGEKGIAQTSIAYVSNISGKKEVYLMDYDGYNPRRITGDRSIVLSPNWTPDGKWVTYTSFRSGTPDLYVVDLSTSRRWKMAGFPGINISPAWDPGGERLAFASSKDGDTEIYLLDRSGKNIRRITFNPADDLSPSWNPSGNAMVFTSDRGGSPQLYLMNADGSNVRRLTFSGKYNSSPSWSPKGNWIAYTCGVDLYFHICMITPDGQQEVQLTVGPWDDESPSWAPDGRHLVFSSNREGKFNLYMMNADGTDLVRLTFNGADNVNPSWSPAE